MDRLEQTNIACLLDQQQALRPDQQAVFCPAGRDHEGRPCFTQLTFNQLKEQSDVLARGLREIGITGGVRTVLMVPPSLEFFILTFALFKAGAIPILIDPGMGFRNLRSCFKEAAPEAFIGNRKAHIARTCLRWGGKTLQTLVTVHDKKPIFGTSYAQLEALGRDSGEPLYYEGGGDDTAAILFTSGSTGPPKGAIYTQRIFLHQVKSLQSMYDIQPAEIDLSTFPLFALFAPALGMTAIIPEMDPTRPAYVDPDKIFAAIDHFGVTNLFGSPALLDRVGQAGFAQGKNLPSLKRVISAGAPVPSSVLQTFQTLLSDDVFIHTPYGATEALPVTTISSKEVLQETRYQTDVGRGTCVGRPVEGIDVAVIGISEAPIARWSDRLRLSTGAIGEICVLGDQVSLAYDQRPKATEMAKIADSGSERFWHRMGDVGYFDEEGRLWFCGRKNHRVIGTRHTWYTIPVEAVFNTHPLVRRTALVGKGKQGRQKPILCVELHQQTDPARWDEIKNELKEIGARFSHTEEIDCFLHHPGFPVDIRHNAKIFREKLASWAKRRACG